MSEALVVPHVCIGGGKWPSSACMPSEPAVQGISH